MLIQRILRKADKALHPVTGQLWCLHRVVEQRSPMPSNRALEITPAMLEKYIADALSQGYRFVDIDTLLHATRHCRARKLINISFDDGFVDIYTRAYPLFQRLQIPFTVYLTTDMPDGKADLWWMQLEEWANGDTELFERIMKQCYEASGDMRDTMHALTQTTVDERISRQVSLSWAQLAEMQSSGLCTVGSHTVSHSALTRIGAEKVVGELRLSAQCIAQHLGQVPRHFSYPHSFYNETLIQQVRDSGYQSAALGYGGEIRFGDSHYLLPRVYITAP